MKFKLPFLVSIVICMTACTDNNVINEFSYRMDARTNLCFATIWNGVYGGSAFTNVPCTPEVLNLIKNQDH